MAKRDQMIPWTALHSTQDASINYTLPYDNGLIECRYVRRDLDTVLVYLSTQAGCKQACRFCHLTAHKETQDHNASRRLILDQAIQVLSNADLDHVKYVYFNFMARGEPFASEAFLKLAMPILQDLMSLAWQYDLYPKFKISTILPSSLPKDINLATLLGPSQPDLYYSIYSIKETFRKRWIPKAMPVPDALRILKRYQDITHKIVRLHWALIEGENDDDYDLHGIMDAADQHNLRVDVNLVQYNPAGPGYGREASEHKYKHFQSTMQDRWPSSQIQIVPRIGYDVFASCGMFADGKKGG